MGKLLAFSPTFQTVTPLDGDELGPSSEPASELVDQEASRDQTPNPSCRAHQLMRARNLIARAAALVAPLGHGGERAGWMLEDCLDMLAEIDLEGVEPAAGEEKIGSAAGEPRKSQRECCAYESTNLSSDTLEQIECTALSQLYAELCSTPEAFLPIEASTESNIIPFSRSL